MYQKSLMLDRVIDFPAVVNYIEYADDVAEGKDIPTSLNILFMSLIEKIIKYSLFPLSIKHEWGEEWAGYDGMIPNGIFYIGIYEDMFFYNNNKLFYKSFRKQKHTRIKAYYNSNINEIHIYFYCLGDYELAKPIIERFFSMRPNLKIDCLVFYCFEDRLSTGESASELKIQSLEKSYFV